MSDSRVALGLDRLPWLPDEPARPARRRSTGLFAPTVVATLLVAGISYWLGSRVSPELPISRPAPSAQPSATMTLPEPRRVEPTEEVAAVPAPEIRPVQPPEVRPAVQPPSRISSPPVKRLPRSVPPEVVERVKRTVVTEEIDRVSTAQGTVKKTAAPPATPPDTQRVKPANTQRVKLWSAWESAGASGRVVQIGAFGSRIQAKLGWRHMVRAYPAVRRLQAVVVETHNSRGRPFYRFQIGTTSQAHSEVLCQRMEKIRFSCAVVGLPGSKRAVER